MYGASLCLLAILSDVRCCFAILHQPKVTELPQDTLQYLESAGATLVTHNVELTYDHWTSGELFCAICIYKAVEPLL